MIRIGRSAFWNILVATIGINILLFAHYMSVVIISRYINVIEYPLYEGVGLFFNFNKKKELLVYVIDVVVMFLMYYAYIYKDVRLRARYKDKADVLYIDIFRNKYTMLSAIVISAGLPALIFFTGSQSAYDSLLLRMMLQSVIVCYLIMTWLNGYKKPTNIIRGTASHLIEIMSDARRSTVFLIMLIAGVYGQVIYLLYEPIFKKPKIVNEYYGVPESTLVNKRYYDNSAYFNANIKSPITYKYDVVAGDLDVNTVRLGKRDLKSVYRHESDLKDNALNQIFYNKDSLSTSLNMPVGDDLILNQENPIILNVLDRLMRRTVAADTTKYSKSVIKFLKNNRFEMHQQVLSRFMIHHHNFILAPLNELYYGKDVKNIVAQYGLGGAMIIGKILTFSGGISLHGWLKICYLFYLIYFIFLIFTSYKITGSYYFACIVFMLSVGVMNNRGYDILILPPGDSPWREFMDIPILLLMYWFGVKRGLIYLASALLLAVFQVVINPQFGAMMLMAVICSAVFIAIREKENFAATIVLSLVSLISGVAIYIKSNANSGLSKYYFDGMVGVKIEYQQILLFIMMFMVGYLLLYRVIQKKNGLEYASIIYLLLYSQALFLYVVWHYDKNGITSRFHIYILTALLIIQRADVLSVIKKYKNSFLLIVSAAAVVFYVRSVVFVVDGKYEYDQIFKRHKAYEWNMKRADIVSTMNPEHFNESIMLIKEYSPDQRGLYIISKYDNILPFLSERYSMMPFFDMQWYCVTDKEVYGSIKCIKDARPEYLFVDTDIYRNFNNDLIDPKIPVIGYLSQESIWRVQRLKLLNKIFEGVSGDYTLIKKGILISIYKRVKA
ncbi:MAG TPA: hypothetical protein VN367_10120 [Chlorobaculum sp.]|nr:hypothetical protein [Chlorobaculum sp.]